MISLGYVIAKKDEDLFLNENFGFVDLLSADFYKTKRIAKKIIKLFELENVEILKVKRSKIKVKEY